MVMRTARKRNSRPYQRKEGLYTQKVAKEIIARAVYLRDQETDLDEGGDINDQVSRLREQRELQGVR